MDSSGSASLRSSCAVPLQPMKCLCQAKGCRGFVGGTQETIAAR